MKMSTEWNLSILDIKLSESHYMTGSNHFNHSQERLHCDYVTNILQKEMILGIPDQVISYNLSSMFP